MPGQPVSVLIVIRDFPYTHRGCLKSCSGFTRLQSPMALSACIDDRINPPSADFGLRALGLFARALRRSSAAGARADDQLLKRPPSRTTPANVNSYDTAILSRLQQPSGRFSTPPGSKQHGAAASSMGVQIMRPELCLTDRR